MVILPIKVRVKVRVRLAPVTILGLFLFHHLDDPIRGHVHQEPEENEVHEEDICLRDLTLLTVPKRAYPTWQ